MILVIENKEAIRASVVAPAFWDLLKFTWTKTLGLVRHTIETPTVQRLNERSEPFIGDIEESLESALEEAHRPIKNCSNMSIAVSRTRVSDEVVLDANTLKSVSIKTENDIITGIVGNVTKYNILTGTGRFYEDDKKRIVSFKILEDTPQSERNIITESIHNAQKSEGEGKIELHAKKVVSAKGVLKRYLVHKVLAVTGPVL